MKFDVYGRFQLEVAREGDRWVAYKLDFGKRLMWRDLVIPSNLEAPVEFMRSAKCAGGTANNQEQITIADYSPSWPAQFAAEAEILRSAFATRIRVEHVGSTAVPGLAAKPIIDILLGAVSLVEIERVIPRLEAAGYLYVPVFERQLPERRYFVKPRTEGAHFHLHAVEADGTFWESNLRFRDALREQPALCEEYLGLKRRLAASFQMDRAAYTDGKASFIHEVLSGHKGCGNRREN